MVCSLSPYFTDEEFIQTIRLLMGDYDTMWFADYEYILNQVREYDDRYLIFPLVYLSGTKWFFVDRLTGTVQERKK